MSLQTYTREYNRRMNAPAKPKEQEINLFHWTAILIIGAGYGLVMAMFIMAGA